MIRYTKQDQIRFDEYHKILAAMEPKIFRAFTDALASVEIDLTLLTDLFTQGKLEDVMRLIGFDRFDRVFAESLLPSLEAIGLRGQTWSADRLAGELPGLTGISFSVLSQDVKAALITQAATLIENISSQNLDAVRSILVDAFNRGVAPSSIGELITNVVGLDTRRATAVNNFSAAVDEVFDGTRTAGSVERQYRLAPKIRGNRDKIKARYAARQLRARGRMIARHETISAFSRGRRAAWGKMVDAGALKQDQLVQWITTPDERACPICVPLHGTFASVTNGIFIGTNAAFEFPPAHIGCRCDTIVVLGSQSRTPERRAADTFLDNRLAELTA